jgi:hypothetical protein
MHRNEVLIERVPIDARSEAAPMPDEAGTKPATVRQAPGHRTKCEPSQPAAFAADDI